MNSELRYIELKSGYSDDGPAWIGKVKLSKSGKTIYFNNKAFRKGLSTFGNYYDIETKEDYWISGVKKDGSDRHWAGKGKIILDKSVVEDYLKLTGQKTIDNSRFVIAEIPDIYPVKRINELENTAL